MQIRDRIKELRRVRAGDLLPHPSNWRSHTDGQRAALQGILAEVGYVDALMVRETPEGLQIVDGHLRAETTPDTEVPVLVVDLTDDEAKKVLATFDPLGAMAEANAEALGKLLADIETNSEGVQAMLEELAEQNDLDVFKTADEPVDAPAQIDQAEELLEKWQVKAGDLWEIPGKAGVHRVLCGDSTKREDVERVMGGAVVGLCFTSPPYTDQRIYAGNADLSPTHLAGFIPAAAPHAECFAVNLGLARVGGFVNCYWDAYTSAANAVGLGMLSWNVWSRDGLQMSIGQATAMFPVQHEWILVYGSKPVKLAETVPNKSAGVVCTKTTNRQADGTKKKITAPVTVRKCRELGTVISVAQVGDSGSHTAAYPVDLPAEYIKAFDSDVYDPFLGSGTTIVAAENLGRVCYGIELAEKYVAVVLERLQDLGLEPRRAT